MLKVKLVCVGNIKDEYFKQAFDEYSKRLGRYCALSVVELKECTQYENIEQIKQNEEKEILKNLSGFVVLMDILGKNFSSEDFALKISEISNINSEITFVIGGSYGVTEAIKQKANLRLSFSKMTFPHMLFRVMLIEQIYRAFTILNNTKYHK